ncbi:MAG: hypoxanthine-guanine phosphoribosyltransferase [Gammaproteobacteria bacterium]
MSPDEAVQVLESAELLHDEQAVRGALDQMAAAITEKLAQSNPVILCIMNGGLMPCSWLVERLHFPFELDYLHATRYRGETSGGELVWQVQPHISLTDRQVLLVDDILDEGLTLAGIIESCRNAGAREVMSAVLVIKQHNRRQPGIEADFRGLEVDDRYVFGCGMDYRNYWRNLKAIYALSDGA